MELWDQDGHETSAGRPRSPGLRLLALLALVLVISAASLPTASAASATCGMTITSDHTLDRSIVNCPSWGVRIDGPNVDLDLGGYVIRGSGIRVGIDLGPNATGNITITNGTVQSFRDGIGTPTITGDGNENPDAIPQGGHGATSVSIRRVRVVKNARNGIVNRWRLLHIEDSRIDLNKSTAVFGNTVTISHSFGRFERNVVYGNGGAGLESGYESNYLGEFTFRDNVIASNRSGLGFGEFGAPREIANNIFDDNGGGIGWDPRACSKVTGNRFRRNKGPVLALDLMGSGRNCSVTGNQFRENDIGVLMGSFASGYLISSNVFTRNRTAGLYAAGDPWDGPDRGNLVEGNVFAFNGFASNTFDALGQKVDDGIHITHSKFGTLQRNQARDNADLGIEAAPITDGGSNWAIRNGNPAQCRGVRCHS